MQLRELSEKLPPLALGHLPEGILGRDQEADYVVADATVSRRHALLSVRQGRLLITDLASRNGSFVNGAEVRDVTRAAAPGDAVQFGSLVFRLELEQSPSAAPVLGQRSKGATVVAGGPPQRDLLLARRIQQSMVGGAQTPSDYAVSHWYQPARELSGDLLLHGQREAGELWVLLGDVCDKGLPSSLLMAFLTGAARSLLVRASSPAALLDELGDLVRALALPGMFATAVAAVFDTRQHRCEIALAGHAPALLRRRDGTLQTIEGPPGTALGAAHTERTVATRVPLAPGDSIILHSDGVEECQDQAEVCFGLARWQELVARTPPSQLCEAIARTLLEHRGPREWHDDIAVLQIQRMG